MSYPNTCGYKEKTTSMQMALNFEPQAEIIRWRVLEVFNQNKDKTFFADEIAKLLDMSVLSIRPRVAELYKKGFVVEAGRAKNYFGNSVKTFKIGEGA
jgi:hypothetical protein